MNPTKESILFCRSVAVVTLIIFCNISNSNSQLIQRSHKGGCICPGDKLIFECRVVGGSATVWKGSIFNCLSDDILLRHRRFSESEGVKGDCNDGAILAQSIQVTGDNYTSELNVTVTSEMNNKSVECSRHSVISTTIGSRTISIPAVMSPSDVTISEVNHRKIVFSWDHTFHNCPSLQYNIITSNCGDCPSNTTSNFVICSNVTIREFPYICSFIVQPVVCGNIFLLASKPVAIYIQGPPPPVLIHLQLFQNKTSYIVLKETNPVLIQFNISITSYTIKYSDSLTDVSCGSATLNTSSCINGMCRYVYDTKRLCPNTNSIKVAIFATNALGDGKESVVVLDSTCTIDNNDFGFIGNPLSTTLIYSVVGWTAFVLALFALVILTMFKCFKKISSLKSDQERERISDRQRRRASINNVDPEANESENVVYSLIQNSEENKPFSHLEGLVVDVTDQNFASHEPKQLILEEPQNESTKEYDQPLLACAESATIIYENRFNEIDKSLNLDSLLIQIRSQVTPKWYQFGVAVGISKETLDELSNFPPEECVVEMLDLWLRRRETAATWRDVSEVLKQIGLYLLAEKILKIYKIGKIQTKTGTEVTPRLSQTSLVLSCSSQDSGDDEENFTVHPSLPPKSYQCTSELTGPCIL